MITKATYYQDKNKEDIHRRYWKNIFRITNEENLGFDRRNETMVLQEIEDHHEAFTSDAAIDLNNLTAEHELINPITTEEIITTIKEWKNKSPGL